MFYTLSIIITFHKEGVLAYKSLNNLIKVINYSNQIKSSWDSIELVAILDNPDENTKNIVKSFQHKIDLIEFVDYKEPSSSRNHGTKIASGNFILFVDGDDFFSIISLHAIYKNMYNHYSNNAQSILHDNIDYTKHIAVFPATYIEFPKIYVHKFVDSNNFIKQNMMFHHLYVARICCLRNIILKYPVSKNDHAYGFEDWDLNNRLLSLGVNFKIAHGFDVYYRKKIKHSVFAHHMDEKCIVRFSPIYEQERIVESILEKDEGIIISNIENRFIKLLHKIKAIALIRIGKLKKINGNYFKHVIFLISNNEKYLSINKHIYGDYANMSKILSNETVCFFELREFLKGADFVFFAPWVTVGGADRLLIEYVNILLNKGYHVKVVLNIELGERINQINCEYYSIGKDNFKWSQLSESNQLHILIKAIISSKIKLLHIVNSEPMLKIIKYYSSILKEYDINFLVTFFGLDIDHQSNMNYIGFPLWYKEVYNNANTIIGDNQFWYNEYKKINNSNDFTYIKLFSPIIESKKYLPRTVRVLNNKILWASRICNQKLFDQLAGIIYKMSDKHFIIYGSEPEDHGLKHVLRNLIKLPNVEFRGKYQNLDEIDLEEFDLYLYTSLFDGIPTILLDMINNYLPVICSNVGGISEVVGEDYSFLVNDVVNIEDYISKINQFYNNPVTCYNAISSIRSKMLELHNYDKFVNSYYQLVSSTINS
jgi:glycosyltransferase involved in cell wall biosynthesis